MQAEQVRERLGPVKDLAFLLLVYSQLWTARLLLWILPFEVLKMHLGRSGVEGPSTATAAESRLARRVAAAIDLTSRFTPFKATCIVQALAARRVLALKGAPSTLYFGVHKLDKGFGAHAWLRVGPDFVTGGATQEANTVVGVYSR